MTLASSLTEEDPAQPLKVVGLMSGTSCDGVDIAYLETNGTTVQTFGAHKTVPYPKALQKDLLQALKQVQDFSYTKEIVDLEQKITDFHIEAVRAFQKEFALPALDLIGFHGHTLLHRPDQHKTWQLGDGLKMAKALQTPVIYDFRRQDVHAGGQGAPLVPAFHKALHKGKNSAFPLVILNVGGVANLTWMGADGEFLSFDTGPGNGPLDTWMQQHTDYAFDKDGKQALAGEVDTEILEKLMNHPYFQRPLPKSADRFDFTPDAVQGLSVEAGAATLTAASAASIAHAMSLTPTPPKEVWVTGGGRYNQALMRELTDRLPCPVLPIDNKGISGDALEAQAFAYLAARSYYHLPLTWPETTGVPVPQTGGILVPPLALPPEPEEDETFEAFSQQFKLGGATTEQHNPITKTLSQTFKNDPIQALHQLHAVDDGIRDALQTYALKDLPTLRTRIQETKSKGGRVFIVGAGSSGRIALDLAAKAGDQVIGVLAGGASAFIRPREGFEDSLNEGRTAIIPYDLSPDDTVILLSASGSAFFNVGAGLESRAAGAKTFYLYNSATVPQRTQDLFDTHDVQPILINTGAQAITGSTRLQAATVGELAIGMALCEGDILPELRKANARIPKVFQDVNQIIQLELDTFQNPDASVTFVGGTDVLREIMMDATETSPTFGTNPPERTTELTRKRAEFRAYHIGSPDNDTAWKYLYGTDIPAEDHADTAQVLVAATAEGTGSFSKRPKGPGNLVIGVLKEDTPGARDALLNTLSDVHEEGGKTALIAVLMGGASPELKALAMAQDAAVVITDISSDISCDTLGVLPTVILKQTLNMISNGAMVGVGKVDGNRMIDVRASNNKLIDRCMRLVQEIYGERHPTRAPMPEKLIYDLIRATWAQKKQQEEAGLTAPSPVQAVLNILQA